MKPQHFFLLVGLVVGCAYLVLVPPFQSPDEFNHFYRAWQISDGQLLGIRTPHRLGGWLPQSVWDVAQPFRLLPFHFEEKISVDTIWEVLQLPLRDTTSAPVFVDFSNTAIYAPTAYIPSIIAIWLGKLLVWNPLAIMYFARFATLCFYIGFVYAAIGLMPKQKWLLVWIALLPSALFINSSISADVSTNALSFLILSMFLKWTEPRDKSIPTVHVILLLLATLLVSINKIAYMPLCALVWLVPKSHFGILSKTHWALIFLVLNTLIVLYWAWLVQPYWLSFDQYDPAFRLTQQINEGVNPNKQLVYILQHPFDYLCTMSYSLWKTFPHTIIHYIGKFGWEKNYFPLWLILPLGCCILLQACAHGFLYRQKIFLVLIGLSMVVLTTTIMYMIWDKVGDVFVSNLAGKYFIPIYPLFLLAMPHLLRLDIHKEKLRPWFIGIWLISLLYGGVAVVERYYL